MFQTRRTFGSCLPLSRTRFSSPTWRSTTLCKGKLLWLPCASLIPLRLPSSLSSPSLPSRIPLPITPRTLVGTSEFCDKFYTEALLDSKNFAPRSCWKSNPSRGQATEHFLTISSKVFFSTSHFFYYYCICRNFLDVVVYLFLLSRFNYERRRVGEVNCVVKVWVVRK